MNQETENTTHATSLRSRLLTVAVNACRIVVALTFIFSGYVKAIDPLGTQYKIDDYLTALSMQGVVADWVTLTASILLAAAEFTLGILLLLAIRRHLVSKIIVAFLAVMTLITVWLAVANPIKDCGCFGDAIHLSNVETLIKNILLLALSLVVARWPQRMMRFLSISTQWIAINYTLLYILATSVWSLYSLPVFDFRPYHIGANIPEGMEIPEGAKAPQFETTFILEKNGVQKEFTLDNYPDSTWTFIDSKTVQTAEGYTPPIHDFSITDRETGDDITSYVLGYKGYTFMLIAPHLEQADDSSFGTIDQLYEYAHDHGYRFLCLTASDDDAINQWKETTGADYPFYTTDETTLKTIIRSNPGLVLMRHGWIINKWSHNTLPKDADLSTPLNSASWAKPSDGVPGKLLAIVLWFILPLALLVLADRTWAWTRWIKRNKRPHPTLSKGEGMPHPTRSKGEGEASPYPLQRRGNA